MIYILLLEIIGIIVLFVFHQWILGVILLLFFIWSLIRFVRKFKLLMAIQRYSQEYPFEFKHCVMEKEGWEVSPREEFAILNYKAPGKGWIKIIPKPYFSTNYCYYIRWVGYKEKEGLLCDEECGMEVLIESFKNTLPWVFYHH